jgi:DNA repair protein RadD
VILRPYQVRDIARIRQAWAGGARRVLYVLPTGGGKTVLFASLAQELRGTTAIIAHRRKLIRQASAKLTVEHGLIMPGHPFRPDLRIQVGSIQTIGRRLDRMPKFDLIVPDEAHHTVAAQWQALFESQPQARVLGVTATPERTDSRGLGELFDVLIEGPSIAELIADGYLVTPRVFAPPGPDLSAVPMRAGDFAPDELTDAMDKPLITGDAVNHYGRLAAGLPAVVFCASVAHAEHVAEAFRAEAWNAVCVHGDTPDGGEAAFAGLADGSGAVVTSCSLIDEGVDVPAIGCVIDLAPTASLARYMQRVGRGLRPDAGKSHLIVLDHAGNTLRHGMPQAPREWTLAGIPRKERTAPVVRQCPICYAAHPPAAVCPACGHRYKTGGEGLPKQFEFVDGELVEIVAPVLPPLKDALAGCTSWVDVEALRVARGYKHGWTDVIMRQYNIARKAKNLPESSDPTADFPVESVIVTAAQARVLGLKRYFTGEELPCGHASPQSLIDRDKCMACAAARAAASARRRKQENPEAFRAGRLKANRISHEKRFSSDPSGLSAYHRDVRIKIIARDPTAREREAARARASRARRKAERQIKQIMAEDREIPAALQDAAD